MSDTLFDISPEDVPDKKKPKKAKKKAVDAEKPGIAVEQSFSVKPASVSSDARGRVVEDVACVDDRCGCGIHDVTAISRNWWRIECWACGTGQWVEPSHEALEEDNGKATGGENEGQVSCDFVFDDGWLTGKTIAEVVAECGLETVKMLACDARHPRWRGPLEKWLAENGAAR